MLPFSTVNEPPVSVPLRICPPPDTVTEPAIWFVPPRLTMAVAPSTTSMPPLAPSVPAPATHKVPALTVVPPL